MISQPVKITVVSHVIPIIYVSLHIFYLVAYPHVKRMDHRVLKTVNMTGDSPAIRLIYLNIYIPYSIYLPIYDPHVSYTALSYLSYQVQIIITLDKDIVPLKVTHGHRIARSSALVKQWSLLSITVLVVKVIFVAAETT